MSQLQRICNDKQRSRMAKLKPMKCSHHHRLLCRQPLTASHAVLHRLSPRTDVVGIVFHPNHRLPLSAEILHRPNLRKQQIYGLGTRLSASQQVHSALAYQTKLNRELQPSPGESVIQKKRRGKRTRHDSHAKGHGLEENKTCNGLSSTLGSSRKHSGRIGWVSADLRLSQTQCFA